MKILVIPDVHLKPWMFERAAELMRTGTAGQALCLMDIADDWRQQFNIDLYIRTFDAAIAFAEEYPDSLWCCGNHDISYVWEQRESGYSDAAPWIVRSKLRLLQESLRSSQQLAYLHRIDDVVFCHGGLADTFVRNYIPKESYGDTDAVLEAVNQFGREQMWQYESPIWYRPQGYERSLYRSEDLLQVVGHTPVRAITKTGNLISCDVFSTRQDLTPIGTQEYLLIDTSTWEYRGIK